MKEEQDEREKEYDTQEMGSHESTSVLSKGVTYLWVLTESFLALFEKRPKDSKYRIWEITWETTTLIQIEDDDILACTNVVAMKMVISDQIQDMFSDKRKQGDKDDTTILASIWYKLKYEYIWSS